MMILARVNGYYSPFFPSTIGQEEEQAETGHIFNLAEENFFRYRLQTLYPKIDEEGIKSAIGFLATQKLANCPCSVHTEERGYEWIVFRRQPDRKIYSTDNDDDEQSYTSKSTTDDDVFFSAEAGDATLDQRTDIPEPTTDCTRNLEKKSTPPDVLEEDNRPQMSTQPRESSLHSREKREETSTGEPSTSRHQAFQKSKKKKSKKSKGDKKTGQTVDTATENPMSIEDDDQAEKCDSPKKRKGFAYYPLLTYKRELDKTFYFKYFIPYSHDYRRLRMEEDCQCPHSEPHHTSCEWYDPNIIYILESPDDISASEEAAQQKIYDLYMKSMNSSHHQTEYCGCGSAAEIAYMGHHTGCSEFQYVHERESYEVLLAMLKKKKKVSLPDCPFNKKKRPRLQSPPYVVPRKDDTDERPKCAKTPLAKLMQKVTGPALNADSVNSPEPSNPPESLSDQLEKINDGFVCSHDTNGERNGEANGDTNDEPKGQADEEMPPLVDETEV